MVRILMALLLCGLSIPARAVIVGSAADTSVPPATAWKDDDVRVHAAMPDLLFINDNVAADVRLVVGNAGHAQYAVDLPYGDGALIEGGVLSMSVTSGNCCASILLDFAQRSDPATRALLAYDGSLSTAEVGTTGITAYKAALPILGIAIVWLAAGLRGRRATARN